MANERASEPTRAEGVRGPASERVGESEGQSPSEVCCSRATLQCELSLAIESCPARIEHGMRRLSTAVVITLGIAGIIPTVAVSPSRASAQTPNVIALQPPRTTAVGDETG